MSMHMHVINPNRQTERKKNKKKEKISNGLLYLIFPVSFIKIK